MKTFVPFILSLCLLCACNSKTGKPSDSTSTCTGYAELISFEESDNFTLVTIQNPWKPGAILQRYALIDRKAPSTPRIDGVTVLRVPLQKVLVYSSVHAGIIGELNDGSYSSIAGVCDAQYFNIDTISKSVANGSIADCGKSEAPSLEKIIELQPDAIILSPFMNAGYGALATIGVPIIECADYMEASPLGRAEWVKFFGLLFGKASQADSIFNSVEQHYTLLRDMAAKVEHRPKVITETVLNGIWYVPGGKSYMAQILADAGADYPWADNNDAGSLQLDFTKVFDIAHDAEFWLVKGFGQPVTRKSITDIYELNSHFDAFKNGGIYACDTQLTSFFTDFPFHPDMLLEEYISIFHPSLLPGYNRQYFYRIEQ